MKNDLELFKERHCFNKEDIQREFKSYMEQFEDDAEEDHSETYRTSMFDLCERFENALNQCNLPQLTDDWWHYDFMQTNDGIELRLYFCKEFDIDEKGIWSTTSAEKFTLLSVKCDYFTVEQFAQKHNVNPVTVRQWIRRGKLRTAKKVGRDWFIPSIASKPTRGFSHVTYHWDRLPIVLADEFPFLKGYDCVYIMQNEDEKSVFDCILGYPGQSNRTRVALNTSEREKLELALISSSVIRVDE